MKMTNMNKHALQVSSSNIRTRIGMLALAVALGSPAGLRANDLIVNGTTVTVPGGTYDTVFITNEGTLNVDGNLGASIINLSGGTVNVSGLVTASSIELNGGTMTVRGATNIVSNLVIATNCTANVLGFWTLTNLTVQSGGKMAVVTYDSATPLSGTLTIQSDVVTVCTNGLISADAAGYDARGAGGCFGASGGGGFGGVGGMGYWDASCYGGTFIDAFTFENSMGGPGGFLAGGAITILAGTCTCAGTVRANGHDGYYLQFQYAPGGGSGGGILIKAGTLSLTGTLAANGGNGDAEAGPGGGGRIKLFYSSGGGASLASRCSVQQGPNHPGNRGPAGAGTVWIDAIPGAPAPLSPGQNQIVPGNAVVVGFTVTDASVRNDNRRDSNFCILELSRDNFATVWQAYDQTISLSGWSKFVYYDGDTATFTIPGTLPEGVYEWRARVKDRSLAGDNSVVRTFIVGTPTYIFGPALQIAGAVELSFQSQTKHYRLQSSPDLATWSDTATVISGDGTVKRVYVLTSGNAMYYRLLVLN